MADLPQIHQALVEDYRESFVIAAGQLLAQPSWNLEATVVLLHLNSGAVTIGPVRSLPLWLEHLPPELDVDLLPVVTGSFVLGEPSYSIKKVEHLYMERRGGGGDQRGRFGGGLPELAELRRTRQILTAGLNIYVLELVVLHLGESLALLFNGLGRLSFDAGMGSELISGLDQGGGAPETDQPGGFWALTPAAISAKAFRQAD